MQLRDVTFSLTSSREAHSRFTSGRHAKHSVSFPRASPQLDVRMKPQRRMHNNTGLSTSKARAGSKDQEVSTLVLFSSILLQIHPVRHHSYPKVATSSMQKLDSWNRTPVCLCGTAMSMLEVVQALQLCKLLVLDSKSWVFSPLQSCWPYPWVSAECRVSEPSKRLL